MVFLSLFQSLLASFPNSPVFIISFPIQPLSLARADSHKREFLQLSQLPLSRPLSFLSDYDLFNLSKKKKQKKNKTKKNVQILPSVLPLQIAFKNRWSPAERKLFPRTSLLYDATEEV